MSTQSPALFLNSGSNRSHHSLPIRVFSMKMTILRTLTFFSTDKDTTEVTLRWRIRFQSISKFQKHPKCLVLRVSQTIFTFQASSKAHATKQLWKNGDLADQLWHRRWEFCTGRWMTSGKDHHGQAWSMVVDGNHFNTPSKGFMHLWRWVGTEQDQLWTAMLYLIYNSKRKWT